MKMQKELNPYECGIAEDLQTFFGFSPEEAIRLVYAYREPIWLVGGYDPTYDHAESIAVCIAKGITPEQSAKNIRHVSQLSNKDKGIDPTSRIVEIAH